MIEPGTIVGGKYRIERLLGRGGMGSVFGATHVNLGTQVALKFLNEAMVQNPTVVERFMREARASALLKGEHVCRVFDVEREAGVPYIVMELLEGTDLAKRLRRSGPLAVDVAAAYVLQACAGVAEAHAARIVHRDLKPGNLMLTERGDGTALVKVLDFGVAKAPQNEGDFSLTQTSNVMGSPGYMSPEQLRSSKVVDARSDVWALGVILYELVIGVQPFRAETITDLALAIAMDPTPRMLGVTPAYIAIVNRCLEKDPLRRFQDVGELAAALAPLVAVEDRRGVDTVARMLRTSTPRLSNEVTAIKMPIAAREELATERQPVAFPVEDAPPAVTTLRGASGVLARAPERRRRLPWVPVVVAGVVIGVGVAAIAIRTDDGARPASAPVRANLAPEPRPEPPKAEPPKAEPPKAEPPKAEPPSPVPATPERKPEPTPEPPRPEPAVVEPPAPKVTVPDDDTLLKRRMPPAKPAAKPSKPPPKPKHPVEPPPPKDLGESRI